jgi:hypothetical protein
VRAQETIGQGFIFAQEPEQEMLGLNIRRPKLACFVARKKYYAPGFLRVTFKHDALPPDVPAEEARGPLSPYRNPVPLMFMARIWFPSFSLCNQTATNPSTQMF